MSEEKETVTTEETAAPETVSKAEFDKVMQQLHRYKSEAKEIMTKSQAEKESSLREQKRWEELAELKDNEVKSLRERDELRNKAIVQDKKYSAFREAAIKAGIRPEAIQDLELVPLDRVQVETTSSGRIIVNNVESAIEQLKVRSPHWFGSGRTKVATDDPNVTTESQGLVKVSDLDKLSKEAQKTGDYAAYEKAIRQYKQQK